MYIALHGNCQERLVKTFFREDELSGIADSVSVLTGAGPTFNAETRMRGEEASAEAAGHHSMAALTP
jgi:hypothetical protein